MKKYFAILIMMVGFTISANAQMRGSIPIKESKWNKNTMRDEEILTGYLEWSASAENNSKGCFVTVEFTNTSSADVSASAYASYTKTSCGSSQSVRAKGAATLIFGCSDTVNGIEVSCYKN